MPSPLPGTVHWGSGRQSPGLRAVLCSWVWDPQNSLWTTGCAFILLVPYALICQWLIFLLCPSASMFLQVLMPMNAWVSCPWFLCNPDHRSTALAIPAGRTHLSQASLLLSALAWPESPAYAETLAPRNCHWWLTRKSTPGGHFPPWLNDKRSTLTTIYYQPTLGKCCPCAHYGSWCFHLFVFMFSSFQSGVCMIIRMHIYNLRHASWLTTGLFGKAAPCCINKASVLVLPGWAVKPG